MAIPLYTSTYNNFVQFDGFSTMSYGPFVASILNLNYVMLQDIYNDSGICSYWDFCSTLILPFSLNNSLLGPQDIIYYDDKRKVT